MKGSMSAATERISGRDNAFDIARGLVIVLMVCGHLTESVVIRAPIYYFHMPVFFFAAGWFFQKTLFSDDLDTGMQLIKKARRLLVPFLVWSAISLLFSTALAFAMRTVPLEELPGFALSEFFEIFVELRSVWFLFSLFFMSCVLLLVRLMARKTHVNPLLIALALWLLSYLLMPLSVSESLFALYKFPSFFIFMILGCFLKTSKLFGKMREAGKSRPAIAAVAFLAYVAASYLVFDAKLFQQWYYPDFQTLLRDSSLPFMLLYYLLATFGVFSCVILAGAARVESSRIGRWLLQCGKQSLDIYVIHMFFVKFAIIICPSAILETEYYAAVFALFVGLAIVLVVNPLVSKILLKLKPYRVVMRA
jgi:fucose 4-O-acetylase-like acetyltransferase